MSRGLSCKLVWYTGVKLFKARSPIILLPPSKILCALSILKRALTCVPWKYSRAVMDSADKSQATVEVVAAPQPYTDSIPPREYVGRFVPSNPATTTILLFLVATFQAVANGYDASMLNALNILPSYTDYFTLNTTTLSLNTASVWVGGIVAGFFAGQMTDWLGRKWAMFWSAVICIIGAIIQTCAMNIAMFVAARIIIGLASGIASVGASTYLAETVAIQWRAFVLGFFWDAWFIGALVSPTRLGFILL